MRIVKLSKSNLSRVLGSRIIIRDHIVDQNGNPVYALREYHLKDGSKLHEVIYKVEEDTLFIGLSDGENLWVN